MADILSRLGEEVTCSICHDYFTTPKQLNCLHRFCEKCLHSIIMNTDVLHGLICPTCRQVSQKPSNIPRMLDHKSYWARYFPTDFVIASVSEKLKEERDMCPLHAQNEVLSYCSDCEDSICHVCAAVSHRTCTRVESLKREANHERDQLKKYEDTLDRKLESIEENFGLIRQEKESLHRNHDQMVEKIRTEFNTVRQHLADREQQLCTTLGNTKRNQEAELTGNEARQNIFAAALKNAKKDVSSIINLKSNVTLMKTRKRLFRRFPDVQKIIVPGSYAEKINSPVKTPRLSCLDKHIVRKIVPRLVFTEDSD